MTVVSPDAASRFTPESPFHTPRVVEIEPPQVTLAGPLDPQQIYGRVAPLAVEIGCGGGRTLLSMAVARPEWDFLGIERSGEYFRILRDRAIRRRLGNLRVSRTDAAYLMHRFFPDACVTEYHIYFPDPWPKKRHHKRRMFTEVFCADVRRTLLPSGVLYVATDFKDYYEEMLPRLREVLAVEEHPQPWEDAPAGRTNYEVKYIREGRPIYRLVGRQKPVSAVTSV